jgi:hypothetical protein
LALTAQGDFLTLEPFAYAIGDKGMPFIIQVPAGFRTDLASIPRMFWPILPPHGVYSKAAIVHDWLYVTGHASRLVADAVFYEAMRALGVGWFRANIMFMAVRIGGRKPWNKRRGIP